MRLDAETYQLLELIDKNPYLKKKPENKALIEELLEKDILTYGNCGCSLPSLRVTKKGRQALRDR